MNRVLKVAAFAAVSLAAAPFSASATALADGSFEIKGAALPVNDYCYDGFATPGGPACASGAWVGNGVIRSGSGPWGGTTTSDGNYFGFVQGASTLSQIFTATATSQLALNWMDAGRGNYGGVQSYAVSISDGITSTALGSFTTAFGQPFQARSSSPFLVTNGTSYTLSFTGLNVQDATSFIDSVSLNAVPEPASWALMIAGFGLTGAAMRRRKPVRIAYA